MTTLTMPTRELVGLLADVHPFASKDDEDTMWHRVVLRWDGTRLHAMAGTGFRLAWMSWGPDDGDGVQPTLPGNDLDSLSGTDPGGPWELAILPENAKEIATKFKVKATEGELPLRVSGSVDAVRVERDAEIGGVALRSSALARPWDDNAPRIDDMIGQVAAQSGKALTRVGYTGPFLADFCNPKVVRQRGPLMLRFGPKSTYIEIGSHFKGAVMQDSAT